MTKKCIHCILQHVRKTESRLSPLHLEEHVRFKKRSVAVSICCLIFGLVGFLGKICENTKIA